MERREKNIRSAPRPNATARRLHRDLYNGSKPQQIEFWCNKCGTFVGRAVPGEDAGPVLREHRKAWGCPSRTFHGHWIIDTGHSVTITLHLTKRQ